MATNPKVGLNRKMHDAKMNTIDEMHFDVLKGVTKYRIRKKFLNGEYTLPEFGEDKSKDGRNLERRFTAYWKDMIEKFGEEFEDNREALKSKFIARYTYLYEQALLKNDIKDAKAILDSIVKLTGADEPIKQEIDLNGGFVIDFGLDNIVKDGEEEE